jgi:Tfp pilus assembly protein PilX
VITTRLRRRTDDDGFALIFVMLVTMVVMMAVATTLNITTPNILSSKNDQDAGAALAAAQSGIDDVVGYLGSIQACRSTTKICPQALGASSVNANRPGLSGTYQRFTWTTDSSLTADEYVRVHAIGYAGNATKKLTADLSLAPSILSFGYYTNYESQSPNFLYDYYNARTVKLASSTAYSAINAYNNNGSAISVSSPTAVHWNGPATSGTDPYPASICGQHWYTDSSGPGRYTYGTNSVWGETGTINSNSMTRTAACDVVFTSGMTMDGPIYTRDAMLISDGTNGGVGPIFKQPVYTLWGFNGYNTPNPPATPWRRDSGVGGAISSTSPYAPAVAGLDLQLPDTIGTDGLADNYCLYTGPTRVVLNGDGTATVTSPYTKTKNSASDPNCYPSSVTGGIVNFTLNYATIGSSTIYVKNVGTTPTAGWPENGTKSTNTPAANNEVFYLPATGGATAPDQADSSAAASSNCTGTTKFSATSPCAWTGVTTTTDATTSTGWTVYTTGTAGTCDHTFAVTDRELFECEYSQKTSGSPLSDRYGLVRGQIQTDLAGGTCLTGTAQQQADCIETLVNSRLAPANNSNHQYIATATPGTATTGTAQNVGTAPTPPMNGDSMFTSTSNPAQEAATKTPITVTVNRETKTNGNWGSDKPAFTFVDTQSDWNLTSTAKSVSYFPDTKDVTEYNTGATSTGAAAGSTGVKQPGDLYVEGNNSGQLSLIADNDVELTDDITNPADPNYDDIYNPNSHAVDIVAGGNVHNYHPVKCVDQTAADITATDAGWCPNDITGLYRGVMESNGTLYASHPAMQYTNMLGTGARTIDAAIFALAGSFLTDNYNRGVALGNLTVNGGIYQSHRGANGVQWEYSGSGPRPTSGYSLQYHYIDLEHANLPYAPPATGGATTRVWNVVSISAAS